MSACFTQAPTGSVPKPSWRATRPTTPSSEPSSLLRRPTAWAFLLLTVAPGGRLSVADVNYASVYDSFTITVIEALEDLGFCAKGEGGRFVLDGALQAPYGRLPCNTDGGGLCNNHPDFRGGMVRIIEAVRQLREEAAAPVQVPDCRVAVVQGVGMSLGFRSTAAALVLGAEDT